jgi:hypothetical protein
VNRCGDATDCNYCIFLLRGQIGRPRRRAGRTLFGYCKMMIRAVIAEGDQRLGSYDLVAPIAPPSDPTIGAERSPRVQLQRFDLSRVSRISRNSFGPLTSLRFRLCRCSAVAVGSLSRSSSRPAIACAFAASVGAVPGCCTLRAWSVAMIDLHSLQTMSAESSLPLSSARLTSKTNGCICWQASHQIREKCSSVSMDQAIHCALGRSKALMLGAPLASAGSTAASQPPMTCRQPDDRHIVPMGTHRVDRGAEARPTPLREA